MCFVGATGSLDQYGIPRRGCPLSGSLNYHFCGQTPVTGTRGRLNLEYLLQSENTHLDMPYNEIILSLVGLE